MCAKYFLMRLSAGLPKLQRKGRFIVLTKDVNETHVDASPS